MSAYEKIWKIKDKTELDLAVEYWAEQDPDTLGEEAAQELLDLRANLAEAVRLLELINIRAVTLFTEKCPFCGSENTCLNFCALETFLKRMEAE